MKTKNILLLFLLPVLLSGCNRTDLDTLRKIADDHTERLSELKQIIIEGEELLSAIHTLLAEYDRRALITEAEMRGDKDYVIRFSDGDSAVINHGVTPVVGISENNTWMMNGVDSGIKVAGAPGTDAVAPVVRNNNGVWEISTDGGQSWLSTGIPIRGDTGEAGHPLDVSVGANGNWYFNGVDTGRKAIGTNGKTEAIPQIEARPNGDGSYNWWIKNGDGDWTDTGTIAMGRDGKPGADGLEPPYINHVEVKAQEITFIFNTNIPGTLPATNRITIERKMPFTLLMEEDGEWVATLTRPVPIKVGSQVTLPFKYTINSGKSFKLVSSTTPEGFDLSIDFTAKTMTFAAYSSITGYRSGRILLQLLNERNERFTYSIPVETEVFSIDLAGMTFPESYVYNVFDENGEKMAEICREYLPDFYETPFPSTPSPFYILISTNIVIYPFDAATLRYGTGIIMGSEWMKRGTIDHQTGRYDPAGGYPGGKTVIHMLSGRIFLPYEIETRRTTPVAPENIRPDKVTDIDGNEYKVVRIGTQYWTAENLKTERYNTGKRIPNAVSPADWNGPGTDGKLAYPDRDYKKKYGVLYDISAAVNPNLAPAGWHIPRDEEWKKMELYLKMAAEDIDKTDWREMKYGGMLKSEAWDELYDNCIGFSALPGGFRIPGGDYKESGTSGYWWTSTLDGQNLQYRQLKGDYRVIYRNSLNYGHGCSVRCVRNR